MYNCGVDCRHGEGALSNQRSKFRIEAHAKTLDALDHRPGELLIEYWDFSTPYICMVHIIGSCGNCAPLSCSRLTLRPEIDANSRGVCDMMKSLLEKSWQRNRCYKSETCCSIYIYIWCDCQYDMSSMLTNNLSNVLYKHFRNSYCDSLFLTSVGPVLLRWPHPCRGELTVSCRWTGWVWEITGRSSKLQENYWSL